MAQREDCNANMAVEHIRLRLSSQYCGILFPSHHARGRLSSNHGCFGIHLLVYRAPLLSCMLTRIGEWRTVLLLVCD